MARKRPRVYTEQDREKTLKDVPNVGITEAAKKNGVARSSATRWAREAGVVREKWDADDEVAAPEVAAAAPPAVRKKRGAAERAVPMTSSAAPSPAAKTSGMVSSPPATAQRARRVAKLYTPSQKAEALEAAATQGVTAASDKLGVSRFSIYEWKRQVQKAAAGQGPSPTSGPSPKEMEQKRDSEILQEWKKHPGLGPSQIVNQLARRNIRVGVHTARLVMEDAGIGPQRWIGRNTTVATKRCGRIIYGTWISSSDTSARCQPSRSS